MRFVVNLRFIFVIAVPGAASALLSSSTRSTQELPIPPLPVLAGHTLLPNACRALLESSAIRGSNSAVPAAITPVESAALLSPTQGAQAGSKASAAVGSRGRPAGATSGSGVLPSLTQSRRISPKRIGSAAVAPAPAPAPDAGGDGAALPGLAAKREDGGNDSDSVSDLAVEDPYSV